MGSSWNTLLQKPLTIMFTASSGDDAALQAVEQLVFADPRGGGLVLDRGRSGCATSM
jgi:hypothetical protein